MVAMSNDLAWLGMSTEWLIEKMHESLFQKKKKAMQHFSFLYKTYK